MNLRFGPLSLLLCAAMLAGALASSASAQVNHDDRGRWHHSEYHRPSVSSRNSTYNPNIAALGRNAYYNGYDYPYYTHSRSPQSYYGYGDPYSYHYGSRDPYYGYSNQYSTPQMQYNYRPYSYSQPYYAQPSGITSGYAPYGSYNGYGNTGWGW